MFVSHLHIFPVEGDSVKDAWSWKTVRSQWEQRPGCPNQRIMWQNSFLPNSSLLPETSSHQTTAKKWTLTGKRAHGGGTSGFHCNDTKSMMTIMTWPLSPCPSWLMPQLSKAMSPIFKYDGWYHLQLIVFIAFVLLSIIVAQFWKFEKFVIIEGKMETSPIILPPRDKHCEYFGPCPPTCHSVCLCTQGCAYTQGVCPCEGLQNP